MPPRDHLIYIDDIRDAIRAINDSTRGLTFEQYRRSRLIRSAVEREFMIIGEGLRQWRDLEPEMEKRITAARDIISFRNHLAQAYFAISDETVWGIIEGHLPVLEREIAEIRRDRDPAG